MIDYLLEADGPVVWVVRYGLGAVLTVMILAFFLGLADEEDDDLMLYGPIFWPLFYPIVIGAILMTLSEFCGETLRLHIQARKQRAEREAAELARLEADLGL